MKVLITGGSSLLGKYLIATAPKGAIVEATWYTNASSKMYQVDVANKSQVSYIFERIRPDLVIHCAANGSVDYAENNYQEVRTVNVGGTENVLRAAADYGTKVVYISTNAVFEGVNPPYNEDSPRQSVNAYGSIKRQAEQAVMNSLRWVVIRPFLLYGWPNPGGRGNWATIIIGALKTGQPLKLVNDVIWQPTYAKDCAAAIWQLSEKENEAYNVAAPEQVTLYEFGLKVADVFGLDKKLLTSVPSDYFKNAIARRPRNTAYDLRKLNQAGIELSCIEDGLKAMKKDFTG